MSVLPMPKSGAISDSRHSFFMSCADVWEDCINKLEDLGFPVDGLSGDDLPKLPLSSDPVVAPIIAKAIQDVALLS